MILMMMMYCIGHRPIMIIKLQYKYNTYMMIHDNDTTPNALGCVSTNQLSNWYDYDDVTVTVSH